MAELETMFDPMQWSPPAELTQTLGPTDTTVFVSDTALLPDPPNKATVGSDDTAEIILYTGKGDGALTGCTRGYEGTKAKARQKGELVARCFTAGDYRAFQDNIRTLETAKADKVSGGTAGHIAGLDASGNLTDSGVAVAEVVQSWVVPCTGTYDAGTKTHRVRRDHPNQGVGERFVAAVLFDRDYAQGDTVLFEGAQVTLAYDNAPDTAVASGAFRAGIVKLLNFQKMDVGGG